MYAAPAWVVNGGRAGGRLDFTTAAGGGATGASRGTVARRPGWIIASAFVGFIGPVREAYFPEGDPRHFYG